MYIREDLEEAIKSQFGVETFVYKGIGKNLFNDCDAFIFDTNKGIIAIEIGLCEIYYIYEIEETLENSENSYKMKPKIDFLCSLEGKTCLKINGNTTTLSGVAFDFTEELVLLALEKE